VGDVTGLTATVVMPSQTTTYILSATNAGGTVTATTTVSVTAPVPTPSAALQFYPVAPCRIVDTRTPYGGGTIAAQSTRTIGVLSSACGIPAKAAAYALNVTVVPKYGTLGYLTLWPYGQAQPQGSTINSLDGSIVANSAIIPAGAAGSLSAYASNATNLVLDIDGYFAPPAAGGLQFHPVTPCRVVDTRQATGTFGAPAIAGGTSRSFPIASSSCGVPAASAYALNVTVVPRGGLGYLTAWATGQSQPNVSTLNSMDGTVIANGAVVPAGAGGAVSFYASNTTDLVVDINGYFSPAGSGLNFYALNPCRAADTRNPTGPLGGPILTANVGRSFPLASGQCNLPSTASVFALNLTAVPSYGLGYLTAWPTGQAQPPVSTLNDPKGVPLANSALVPAGSAGSINVFPSGTTHLVIDTTGYFAP
jgi:hypothetical protein